VSAGAKLPFIDSHVISLGQGPCGGIARNSRSHNGNSHSLPLSMTYRRIYVPRGGSVSDAQRQAAPNQGRIRANMKSC
jgi:hypothetical protein